LLDDAYNFIDKAVNNNKRILVHCQKGRSRSPTIVMAWLMRKVVLYYRFNFCDKDVLYDKILKFVAEKRPNICPNLGFCIFLKNYPEKLYEEFNQNKNNTIVVRSFNMNITFKKLIINNNTNKKENRYNFNLLYKHLSCLLKLHVILLKYKETYKINNKKHLCIKCNMNEKIKHLIKIIYSKSKKYIINWINKKLLLEIFRNIIEK